MDQEGPACHTGGRTCFDDAAAALRSWPRDWDRTQPRRSSAVAARERRVIPVYRRFLVDGETAIGLYQKLAGNRPGSYLLESAEQGVWSRYSFIGVHAAATLIERDGEAHWTGRLPAGLPEGGDPLDAVRETLRLLHTPRDPDLPPFTSGLVGYLSYDAVRRVERLPDGNPKDLDIPELGFVLAADLVVVDHHRSEVWLVANAINFDATDERVDEAYADAAARVEDVDPAARRARRRRRRSPRGYDNATAGSAAADRGASSRAPWRPRSRRSRPARRSRSSSASGSRSTPPPMRSTSTGCCG